jgi:hypothetical protein
LPDDESVVEIRAFNTGDGYPKVYNGWFSDREEFVEAALELESKKYEVYATLNLCPPALLARGDNTLRPSDPKKTPSTSDKDITRRRWILADFLDSG